ncbi:MAG: DEAD/DEAH box helicase family protein [Peptostreptococcaceae bacterium]
MIDKCSTGYNDYFYNHFKESIEKANTVDIIVSFLMESGVKYIKKDLELIRNRGIKIRVLTGNYLNITQPSALYMLKDILEDDVDLRFYDDSKRSFHTKAYIFESDKNNEIFIGSSNLSKSAFTNAIEWNYRIDKKLDERSYNYFKETFEDLFLNHSKIIDDKELKLYSMNWKKPKIDIDISKTNLENKEYEPRDAQIEALYELKNTRKNGYDKGLVIVATGVGKTYLSAFDSREFNRVLFVAHREEILNQAYESFKNVRKDKIIKRDDLLVAEKSSKYYGENNDEDEYNMGFFRNTTKDITSDIIFASVQTLGQEKYLNNSYFSKDYFDYIIVDEFHHAVSKNYQNIINYFKPKFMLGLTATPDRLDSKDIYDICDYNVVYELNLKNAIDRDILVPFKYYGIYDETVNYSDIDYKNGKYNPSELEKSLSINNRAELIYNNYKKYSSKRALAFCSSKYHAEFMAEKFNSMGVKSCYVCSGNDNKNEFKEERADAIRKIKNGEMKVIFSVDMFNEGVDISSIDMVMFLRPTQSPTVFLQQLGRGLRKDIDKECLNVLDFIGNYKNINLIPKLLTSSNDKKYLQNNFNINENLPNNCMIDFDFEVIDLFRKFEKISPLESIKIEYLNLKEKLGYNPSRVEFLLDMNDELYLKIKKSATNNIFKDYVNFLYDLNLISVDSFKDSLGHEFIKFIENTSMSKSYKIALFKCFFKEGNIKSSVSNYEIYQTFKAYYLVATNKVDMIQHKETKDFKTWEENKFVSLARNKPLKYLLKSTEFFRADEENIYLSNELKEYLNNEFFIENVLDAIEFRSKKYYKDRF